MENSRDQPLDTSIAQLVTTIGVVVGLVVAYGKAFASYQEQISQAIIDAGQVTSRYKRILNLVVVILVGAGMTTVGALWMGMWEIVPTGVLAGILTAVEASNRHEASGAEASPQVGSLAKPP